MAAIFAIFAIYGQDKFAKLAILLFAFFANTSRMNDLREQQRLWLERELAIAPRGTKKRLAEFLGVRQDAITRMVNPPGSGESREIKVEEILRLQLFFKSDPPGLPPARELALPILSNKPAPRITMVPLLDSVAAGRLREPMSQISLDQAPLYAFTDLGKGEFFAMTVDGDSMDRLSPSGSMIVVDKADRKLRNGKCYVFAYQGEVGFKVWQGDDPERMEPFSTNPLNKPVYIKRKRDFDVIGRVKRTVLDL